jgi:hypothetical protein
MQPFTPDLGSTLTSGLTATPGQAHINRDLVIDQAWGHADGSGVG